MQYSVNNKKINPRKHFRTTFITKLGAIETLCTLDESDYIFDQIDAEVYGYTNFNGLKNEKAKKIKH